MQINTAIFDMDGLLINSEPFWQEAGVETLGQFSITLSVDEYHQSLGLRTKEWLEYWFTQFNIDKSLAAAAEDRIVAKAREKIQTQSGTRSFQTH